MQLKDLSIIIDLHTNNKFKEKKFDIFWNEMKAYFNEVNIYFNCLLIIYYYFNK